MKIIKLPILHYSCQKQNVVKAIVVQMLRVKAIVVTPVLTTFLLISRNAMHTLQ